MRPRSTRIDRYPAKMVSRLASALVKRFAPDARRLLDPFCGSGAILAAGQSAGIEVVGSDINPYAILLSNVKLAGFDPWWSLELCRELVAKTSENHETLPMEWSNKGYWFDEDFLNKYERLRRHAFELDLYSSLEGRAVLLAIALSVRICSKADQRSPKPFISKQSRSRRSRPDPIVEIESLLGELGSLYGVIKKGPSTAILGDLVNDEALQNALGRASHVITSPPYLNAQDYFRNFKLELYILEGVLPYEVRSLSDQFVGTERGLTGILVNDAGAERRRTLVPQLLDLEARKPKLARVVHRYLSDMQRAFRRIKDCLDPGGTLVVIAGDNLVGGLHIRTWEVLNRMIEEMGFSLFDKYGDTISCRAVPPVRLGHKGLIKEEIISAFRS